MDELKISTLYVDDTVIIVWQTVKSIFHHKQLWTSAQCWLAIITRTAETHGSTGLIGAEFDAPPDTMYAISYDHRTSVLHMSHRSRVMLSRVRSLARPHKVTKHCQLLRDCKVCLLERAVYREGICVVGAAVFVWVPLACQTAVAATY